MKKVVVIIFALSLFIVALGLFLRPKGQPMYAPGLPTPTPVGNPTVQFEAIDYSHVFPDKTTEQGVKNILQNPTGSENKNGLTQVSFQTDVPTRPNIVYEKNDTAMYVVQEVTMDNTYLSDFSSTHPNSTSFQLFDAGSGNAGFIWYIFPQDGTAYLANKDGGGYAIKVLYFSPTTEGDFVKNIAPSFNMLQKDPDTGDAPEPFSQ